MEGDGTQGPSEKLLTSQQIDDLVDQILQSDRMLDRLIQKLTTAEGSTTQSEQSLAPAATRFFGRLLSSVNLMPKLCAVIAKEDVVDSDIEATAIEKSLEDVAQKKIADGFLDKLFLSYSMAGCFWTKLIDDDLFAESLLEPVYTSEELLENVTDRFLEQEQVMKLM